MELVELTEGLSLKHLQFCASLTGTETSCSSQSVFFFDRKPATYK